MRSANNFKGPLSTLRCIEDLGGECRSYEIAELTGFSRETIRQYLRALKNKGMVSVKRTGGWSIYTLTSKGRKLIKLAGNLEQVLERSADEAYRAFTGSATLRVMNALRRKERSAGEVVEKAGCTQSHTSQILRKLRNFKVVDRRKEANVCWYRLNERGKRTLSLITQIKELFEGRNDNC